VFFVDVEGHAQDENVAAALSDLKLISKLCRVLGSYPRAVSAEVDTEARSAGARSGPKAPKKSARESIRK
jgi:hypothetical protein